MYSLQSLLFVDGTGVIDVSDVCDADIFEGETDDERPALEVYK